MGEWSSADTNQILTSLWDLGSQLFPEQTEKIQGFVIEQAKQYGIAATQQKLAEIQANPLTPIILIIGAFAIGKAMSRRT